MTTVYWSSFTHPTFQNKPLFLAATDKGLCKITWPSENFESMTTWVEKQIPDAVVIEDKEVIAPFANQLNEYMNGEREDFDVPLDFRGTAFQTSVWNQLTQIPYGQIRSYSEIADALGNPKAVRAVGTANGANPIPIIAPCHRVIGKNAALTGFRGGLQIKEKLLQLEGFHDYTQQGHARFQF
ncbi:methylated-DNA--[protein]-cysteine S-methyltransferase [Bacillus sp. Marseille-Q3570]|uniref:methylated-DNA--[protein]-cysteine S-methyltransferase n=1 Tax=Bacillus sp. Marseille-Q3570 TaxID=2963522 RepID=UPI0021B70D96|nr:methylated-DNA--[protein]-cysteine S-methyltransferase [Bacillus sp. Marseille-Q3570]